MAQEDIDNNIIEVEAEELSEENPLLIAQRYLNIFHQIHIFKAEKRNDFDAELLNLPEKIKRLLINIPGGRILLEHVLDLEEQNGFDTQLTKALIAQRKKSDDILPSNTSVAPQVSGEIKIGNDFANILAKSLAKALGNAPYPQPVAQISDKGGNLPGAKHQQLNTQNNAAATTVNNINVDYSIFQNLADAINKNNAQNHKDFMKMVEAINQNFNPTIVQTDGVPLSAITSSLSQVIRESSRQQMEEMKLFSKTLTDAILGRKSSFEQSPESAPSEKQVQTEKNVTADTNKPKPAKQSATLDNTKTEKNVTADINKPKPAKQSATLDNTKVAEEKPMQDVKPDNISSSQTISIINKTIDPLTAKSEVQKNSYTITPRAPEIKPKKPTVAPKDPLLQAQNVLSRTSLNIKPVSLSADDNTFPKAAVPEVKEQVKEQKAEKKPETSNTQPQYTEYALDENLNMNPISETSEPADNFVDDAEWEYVDEYGNPITNTSDVEWEYVDENGNPLSDADDAEWEYVDENGNPITDDESWQEMPADEVMPETKEEPKELKTETKTAENPVEKTSKKVEEKAEKSDVSLNNQTKDMQLGNAQPNKEELKSSKDENIAVEKASSVLNANKEKKEKNSTSGFLSSLFRKRETAIKEEKPVEEPKKDEADDALAAAFAKPAEKPVEEPKKDEADDALAAAFAKPAEKPIEQPKKDEADDALAAAFAKPAEKPVEQPKKDEADDVLAAAFAKPAEKPVEEPKKDEGPKIGNILADAYKEIEREQKTLSSKDLLAQTMKSKPQTTAELLNSTRKNNVVEAQTNIEDDALVQAFEKTEKKNKNSDFEALIKAFQS